MKSIKFETKLSSFGNNTGIVIPDEVIEKLDAGKRPSLMVKINDYEYQCTPGVMNDKTVLSFSSEHRKNSGLQGGEKIHVELTVALKPRKVEMSEELHKALGESNTQDFFNSLPNSLQRYHCDLINTAKTDETRLRRIQKTVDLF